MLQQMNSPRLQKDWYLVLDGESEQTSTAVIVSVESGEEDEVRVQSVRVAYGVSSRYLYAASIGHPSLDELVEVTEELGDLILRDD